MVVELHASVDIQAAQTLVEQCHLVFERSFDNLVGKFDNGVLVGVGARQGNVLKMLAIEPSHQGDSILGELVSALISLAQAAAVESLFVYTKPQHVSSFEALNFTFLANQGQAALLEFGTGLSQWLAAKRKLRRKGNNAAVVMNCNPFTLGHRYLIATAAEQVDNLYVFIVREDRSVFPFSSRLRLVQQGTEDLKNVLILDTGPYIVSAATFPSYFLKKDDPVARIQMELDISLFGRMIAPYFGITQRFIGTEPVCQMTHAYNQAMQRLLPDFHIRVTEVERLCVPVDVVDLDSPPPVTGVISASRVRALMSCHAPEQFAQLLKLLPECTRHYLQTREGQAIMTHLRAQHMD